MTKTMNTRDRVEAIAALVGGALFDRGRSGYSGRGMMGDHCWAITCKPGSTDGAIKAGLKRKLGTGRVDNLGKDAVVYWPAVAFDRAAPVDPTEFSRTAVMKQLKVARQHVTFAVEKHGKDSKQAKKAQADLTALKASLDRLNDRHTTAAALAAGTVDPAVLAARRGAAAGTPPATDPAARLTALATGDLSGLTVAEAQQAACDAATEVLEGGGTPEQVQQAACDAAAETMLARGGTPEQAQEAAVAVGTTPLSCGAAVALAAPVGLTSAEVATAWGALTPAGREIMLKKVWAGWRDDLQLQQQMKAMSKLMWSAIEPTTRATLAKQLAFQRTLRMYPANYLGPHTALLEEISTAVGTAAVTGAWGTLTATPEALAAPPPAPPPSPAEQRAAKRAARKAAAPAPAAGPVKAKVPAAGAAKWGRVGTASELYKRLIMDEGLDNATCFARVTAELGDKAAGKPSYPGWYRCQLRKDGFDPPVSPPVTPKSNA